MSEASKQRSRLLKPVLVVTLHALAEAIFGTFLLCSVFLTLILLAGFLMLSQGSVLPIEISFSFDSKNSDQIQTAVFWAGIAALVFGFLGRKAYEGTTGKKLDEKQVNKAVTFFLALLSGVGIAMWWIVLQTQAPAENRVFFQFFMAVFAASLAAGAYIAFRFSGALHAFADALQDAVEG